MVDCMVRFLTPDSIERRYHRSACLECGDPPEVVYSYSPVAGVTVHAPYCFDCAVALQIVERASDFARRRPEDAFRLRMNRNTDLTHFSEGTWWVGR